jgi:hypothetical protein
MIAVLAAKTAPDAANEAETAIMIVRGGPG